MIDHLNLTVRSFEESLQWYGRVFGFECVERGVRGGSPWGVLRRGDSMLCIYEDGAREVLSDDSEGDRFHRIYHFGLRITDRSAWEQVIEREHLIMTYASPWKYPHSESWYVCDPSGHEIEVVLWDRDQVAFG